jgi:hypothetical protein
MKRTTLTGATVIAILAITGLLATAAQAKDPLGGPLTCYEVSKFVAAKEAGNWENATCSKEGAKLTFKWVLALPVKWIKENLWCALLTPYKVGTASETGTWETENCSEGKAKTNGEWVEVRWIHPPAIVINESEPTVLINSEKDPNSIKTNLQSTAVKLVGEGFLLELTLLQLSKDVSGFYTMLLLKFGEEPSNVFCHSEGDATGEI